MAHGAPDFWQLGQINVIEQDLDYLIIKSQQGARYYASKQIDFSGSDIKDFLTLTGKGVVYAMLLTITQVANTSGLFFYWAVDGYSGWPIQLDTIQSNWGWGHNNPIMGNVVYRDDILHWSYFIRQPIFFSQEITFKLYNQITRSLTAQLEIFYDMIEGTPLPPEWPPT